MCFQRSTQDRPHGTTTLFVCPTPLPWLSLFIFVARDTVLQIILWCVVCYGTSSKLAYFTNLLSFKALRCHQSKVLLVFRNCTFYTEHSERNNYSWRSIIFSMLILVEVRIDTGFCLSSLVWHDLFEFNFASFSTEYV